MSEIEEHIIRAVANRHGRMLDQQAQDNRQLSQQATVIGVNPFGHYLVSVNDGAIAAHNLSNTTMRIGASVWVNRSGSQHFIDGVSNQ